MKKTNQYFATVVKRTNAVKVAFLTIFLVIGSWPSALLEVFTRKNFGERHFSLALNLFLACLLAAFPFITGRYFSSIGDIISDNFTWFACIIAFLIFSFKREIEIKRNAGTYDFDVYSLSSGEINPWFYQLRPFGIKANTRHICLYYEPGLFFLVGVVLALLSQKIGYVLIVSSVIYSLNWAARYYLGSQFILDTNDERIANQEMVKTFVEDLTPDQTRGFQVHARRPKTYEMRRKIVESMIDEEPPVDVY